MSYFEGRISARSLSLLEITERAGAGTTLMGHGMAAETVKQTIQLAKVVVT